MSANFLDSTNIQGGVYYSSPSFGLTASNASINGGMSFDLPLATIAGFQNAAYQFTNANTKNAFGFLGGVISNQQSSLDNQIMRQQTSIDSSLAQAFGFASNVFGSGIAALQNMHGQNVDLSQYSVRRATRAGGCFITTAICEAECLPDDCETLEIFRGFRDGVLLNTVEGFMAVQRYYDVAPEICDKINASNRRDEILELLKTGYLIPAKQKILDGDWISAFKIYREMVEVAELMVAQ